MSLAESWDRYAVGSKPRRTVNTKGETTWLNWTQYADHGPNESVLGSVAGRRVLELGSGSGSNLAHLVTLGATGQGVDIAPAREAVAREHWGNLPGLEFRTAEATAFLNETDETFDVVLSIFGAVWFVHPDTLLPLIRSRMAPGGILAFSHLPPGGQGPKPAKAGLRHDRTPDEWGRILAGHGFSDVCVSLIDPPEGRAVGTMLVRASAGAVLKTPPCPTAGRPDCLFIDDYHVNVDAARVAGMQAHLFEDNEQPLARIAAHLDGATSLGNLRGAISPSSAEPERRPLLPP